MKNSVNKSLTLKKVPQGKNLTSSQAKTKSFCVCKECFSDKCPFQINMTLTSTPEAHTSKNISKKKNTQSFARKDSTNSLLQMITDDNICICSVFARAFQSNVNVHAEPEIPEESPRSNNKPICNKR